MQTESFRIETIENMFYKLFPNCCDMHKIQYPHENDTEEYEKFKQYMKKLWENAKDEIEEYIYGEMNSESDFSNDYETTKSVLIGYIDFCKEYSNVNIAIDVETYWSEIVQCAIEENAELLFDVEGPCNIYGEKIS